MTLPGSLSIQPWVASHHPERGASSQVTINLYPGPCVRARLWQSKLMEEHFQLLMIIFIEPHLVCC